VSDLFTVGLILMLVGAIGLLIGIWMALSARRRYPAAPYPGGPPPPRETPPPPPPY
jgi:hypothetical protein